MSNSLGTLNGALIAQEALPLLTAQIPMFDEFTTNFSNEPVHYNQSVYTRVHPVVPLSTFDTTNGYVATAATVTDAYVTLNKFQHVTYTFTDADLSAANYDIIGENSKNLAKSLGQGMMSGIASLFTTGNYAAQITVAPLTGVNRNTVITANAALNTRLASHDDRFLIGNSSFIAQLKQDPNLISILFVPGGPGVGGNKLPDIDGATPYDYAGMPTNSQYIQAVIGSKDSVLVAARAPYIPPTEIPGVITNVTDPDTGLTIQSRSFYNPQLGQLTLSFVVIWGYAVGNPASLQIITTQ